MKEWAEGKGVGRGGRSRPGRIELLYVMYPYCQDFLFDFLSVLIIDYSETFWQFIPGD